jgi:hypothetical protein
MMSAMSRPIGEIIFAVEEAPEGGYLARALGHDIFTEAGSLMGSARPCATPCAAVLTRTIVPR